jgi:hypothetical protein
VRRRRIIHQSDPNQKEIVAALRAVGASVDIIGDPVDLVVGWRGRNYLLEVKRDAKAKLQPSQVAFMSEWRGQVSRVNSVGEALAVIGITSTVGGPPAAA